MTTPCTRPYVRVSTEEQEASVAAQRQALRQYYEQVLRPKGFLWHEPYEDRGISGGLALQSRPAGRQLHADMNPGDVVVFAKVDRGFRSLSDLAQTLEAWSRLGVLFVFL